MKIAPLITLAACGGMAVMLWMQDRQIRSLRTDMLRMREEITGTQASTADLEGTSLEDELKHASDIDQRMAKVKVDDVMDFAFALAEVDEWLFYPDEEKSATLQIQKLVTDLRTKINPAVKKELDQALAASSGSAASAYIARAGELFGIYPQPSDDAQKSEAHAISDEISNTARRVDELRRLRYNDWAAGKVKDALDGYYKEKKTFGDDDDALIQSFVEQLGAVDSGHLDPAVSSIYQQVLSTTTEALSEPNRVKLAKSLSSSSMRRKTPLDF